MRTWSRTGPCIVDTGSAHQQTKKKKGRSHNLLRGCTAARSELSERSVVSETKKKQIKDIFSNLILLQS